MKTEVLEKIEQIFWKKDFSEVSMDEVANLLGIKKASVYHHFPSKEMMFLEVLEYSFEKYKNFIEKLFSGKADDMEKVTRDLIFYPLLQKNLFSIVAQKGYCQISAVKDVIAERSNVITKIFVDFFSNKFGFEEEKIVIYKSVVEFLSKKYCMYACPDEEKLEKLINNMVTIFFTA